MSSSLRARILFGALLWSAGIFVVVSGAMVLLITRHAELASGVHHALSHPPLVILVAAACLALGFWSVRRGLSPVTRLRERLAAVHQGREPRLSGLYPSEIQPLVDDMNALLAHQEEVVRRAVSKAADLAHGLKTPLAVLTSEADRAAAAGHTELASAIAQQVERMRRQIDHHLAHARAAASGATPGLRTSVRDAAEGLVRTVQRLYAARAIAIDVQIPAGHAVRVSREDLDEMLGNLLDNACKWTRSRVHVSSSLASDTVQIVIDDDGGGVAPELRERVLQRGIRADEEAPGSGLGLAIVRDLTEIYGGRITLDASPLGGLRARLQLPAAD